MSAGTRGLDGRTWFAGDVAFVKCSDGNWRKAVAQSNGPFLSWRFVTNSLRDVANSEARAAVVLDVGAIPEVGTVPTVFGDFLEAAAQIVEESEPGRELREVKLLRWLVAQFDAALKPRNEVYEHLATPPSVSGIYQALCGKVWRPSQEDVVVGRCPECLSVVDSKGWMG